MTESYPVVSNNFSLSIRANYLKSIDTNLGKYVALAHETNYSIKMYNNGDAKCDAKVTVDGMDVGTFRINPRSNIVIERPVNISKKFTFLKENSVEAKRAGIEKHNSNGLISVVFIPEFQKYLGTFTYKYDGVCSNSQNERSTERSTDGYSLNFESLSSGATALKHKSNQDFHTAEKIEYDYDGETVINLRLVVDDKLNNNDYQSLRSNNYPPRIEDAQKNGFFSKLFNVFT